MIFNWLRRRFRGFRVEDEVRRIMSDANDSLPEAGRLVRPRDVEADDRAFDDLQQNIDAAKTTLFRFEVQAALRKRHGYPGRSS